MWIRSQSGDLVNLSTMRTVRQEGNAIVASKGDERALLFQGHPDQCQSALAHIVDGLTTRSAFLDMKVVQD